MTNTWDAEDIYDEKIQPLMNQILAVCREHDIPIVCSFQYALDEGDEPALCTTVLLAERGHPRMRILARHASPCCRFVTGSV